MAPGRGCGGGGAAVNRAEALVEALVDGPDPDTMIFGVRHHSPTCARAVVAAAEEWRPEAIAIELPAELAPLLPWIADPGTEAPVAVAVGGVRGMGLYPFADFSPELAILRWAHRAGVEVHCIDLPAGAVVDGGGGNGDGNAVGSAPLVDVADLIDQEAWETRVESLSVVAPWRRVRRAALAIGVGVRLSESAIGAREATMRACLAELAGVRTLVVVGSCHCLGLVDVDADVDAAPARPRVEPEAAVSLVPYGFAELDSRSGYASGIRDPRWQQGVVEASGPGDVEKLAAEVITDVARAMRAAGEPTGTGEVVEAARVAGDLARLRGLPAPGRREVIEALTTVFAHGSVLGRAVAAALQKVMVGSRRGRLVDGAPAPALESHVRELLASLGLPADQAAGAALVRIDPFRGGRDLDRHVALARLGVLGVPYEKDRTTGTVRGMEARGYTVTCEYRSATTAPTRMRCWNWSAGPRRRPWPGRCRWRWKRWTPASCPGRALRRRWPRRDCSSESAAAAKLRLRCCPVMSSIGRRWSPTTSPTLQCANCPASPAPTTSPMRRCFTGWWVCCAITGCGRWRRCAIWRGRDRTSCAGRPQRCWRWRGM